MACAAIMCLVIPANAQKILETLEMMENEKGEQKFSYVEALAEDAEDVAIVIIGNKQGLANAKGELLIPMEFQRIEVTEIGQRLVVQKKGKYGLMDKQGKVLIPAEYTSMELVFSGKEFSSAYILVSNGKKEGILRPDGSVFCPIEYKAIDIAVGRDIVAYFSDKSGDSKVILKDGTIRKRGENE